MMPAAHEDPRISLLILIGCLLMIATTFMHAAGMYGAMWTFKKLNISHASHHTHLIRALGISLLVIFMFLVGLFEAALWAGTYVYVGALENFRDSLYFSIVTYTTLGYGDITLDKGWRLLSSFEAANGTMMFGWTTALIVMAVQRIYFPHIKESS